MPMATVVRMGYKVLWWSEDKAFLINKDWAIIPIEVRLGIPILPKSFVTQILAERQEEENGETDETAKITTKRQKRDAVLKLLRQMAEKHTCNEEERQRFTHEAAGHIPYDPQCPVCALAKQKRKPARRMSHHESEKKSTDFGDMWHVDLAGPVQPQSASGDRMILVAVDDATGYIMADGIPKSSPTSYPNLPSKPDLPQKPLVHYEQTGHKNSEQSCKRALKKRHKA